MCSGFACGFFIAGTQTDCNLRADTDTESNCYCILKILHSKNKRQRGHGIFADLGNKETVHDIV